MRTTLIVMILLLTGCAHTRLNSWKNDEFVICGNRWADQTDYHKKAQESCSKDPQLIGGGPMTVGYTFYGGNMMPITQSCLTYSCK